MCDHLIMSIFAGRVKDRILEYCFVCVLCVCVCVCMCAVVLIIFSLYSDIMSGYPKYGLTSTQLVLTLTTLTGPGTMQRYSLRVAPIIYNIICFEIIL